MIVVDANVLVYLLVPGVRSPAARALFQVDDEFVAPVLWRSEVRNALLGCLRRGELSFPEANVLMREADDLMSEREYEVDSHRILELAIQSGCSAYDCEYVALAEQFRIDLVTADTQILAAFPVVATPLAQYAP